MPIRNLTDHPRMPRLGKIRLGIIAKSSGGKDYPKMLDHFVCPPPVVEAMREQGVAFCEGKCGETPGPTELPIIFLSDDGERIAGQWFRAYKASVNLVCRGDGYKADALLDRDALRKAGGDVTPPMPVEMWYGASSKGEVVRREIECLGEGYENKPACTMYASGKCRRLMMLQFAVPDAPGLGVYQLDTGSVNSMLNVNGFLEYLRGLTGGRVLGIPLLLQVKPQEVTAENRKKTVHVLHLSSPFTLTELAEAVRKPALQALLPEPDAPEMVDEEEHQDGVEAVEDIRGIAARAMGEEVSDTVDDSAANIIEAEAEDVTEGGDPATQAQLRILASLWRRIKGLGEMTEHAAFKTISENYPYLVEKDQGAPEFELLNTRVAATLIEELQAIVGSGR